MSPVATQTPRTRRRIPRANVVYALAAVVLLAGMPVALSTLQGPTLADRITVENPSVWQAEVEVSRPDGGSVLKVGTAPQTGSETFLDVLDQGDVWVFRFTYGQAEPVEMQVDRSELELSQWTVTVPEGFQERMLTGDVPPSA